MNSAVLVLAFPLSTFAAPVQPLRVEIAPAPLVFMGGAATPLSFTPSTLPSALATPPLPVLPALTPIAAPARAETPPAALSDLGAALPRSAPEGSQSEEYRGFYDGSSRFAPAAVNASPARRLSTYTVYYDDQASLVADEATGPRFIPGWDGKPRLIIRKIGRKFTAGL